MKAWIEEDTRIIHTLAGATPEQVKAWCELNWQFFPDLDFPFETDGTLKSTWTCVHDY